MIWCFKDFFCISSSFLIDKSVLLSWTYPNWTMNEQKVTCISATLLHFFIFWQTQAQPKMLFYILIWWNLWNENLKNLSIRLASLYDVDCRVLAKFLLNKAEKSFVNDCKFTVLGFSLPLQISSVKNLVTNKIS